MWRALYVERKLVKRTIVYIDGFNLYYGILKGTKYKWLDLKKLCENLLNETKSSVVNDIMEIKYFTAKVHNKNQKSRQSVYWKAIQKHIPKVCIIEGKNKEKNCFYRDSNNQWKYHTKFEEKQTDVNIATHMLNDAWKDKYDVAILISNDSDLKESLKLIKEEHKNKYIMVYAPVKKRQNVVQELSRLCDFHKTISNKILENSQLPYPIPGTKLGKPKTWR